MSFKYSLDKMFDFDQKWNTLPGKGANYCVPTSMCNIMGFLSKNGYESLWRKIPGIQPKFADLNIINNLAIMGDYMETDPDKGTSHNKAIDGLEDFMDGKYTGLIYTRTSADDAIFLRNLKDHLSLKRLMAVGVGRYTQVGENAILYHRSGGHCITVVGLQTNASNATLIYHDPNSGDSDLHKQSSVMPVSSNLRETAIMVDGYYRQGIQLTSITSGFRMMDSYTVLAPLIMLYFDDITTSLNLVQGADWTNAKQTVSRVDTKAVGKIKDLIFNAENTAAYVISENKSGIWKLDLVTMKLTQVNASIHPSRLIASENNYKIFASVNSKIFSLEDEKNLTEVADLGVVPDALTYNFKKKQLIAVAAGVGKLLTIDASRKVVSMELTSGINSDYVNATINPKSGALYLSKNNSYDFVRISLNGNAIKSIAHEELEKKAPVSKMHMNNKGVFAVSQQGKLKFYNDKGIAVSVKDWDDASTGNIFKLSRGFNVLSPSLMEREEWKYQ
ncbi:hypothetical protein QTN47_25380 [Danxiaibacter flavus]|uniref:Peptidase C39-like domain-containing protein n=1 Tax=Danxiaibacter flavus TaxID=3049108 RepID=A0ABV3ZLU3_9BACT|nr:hypothetical protein QNM32_25385 [Chitinophagaceae bacterium DXS]